MTFQLPVTDARGRFSEILEVAEREPVFLTKHGDRRSVLISMAEYERLLGAAEDLEDVLEANLVLAEIEAGQPTIPWEQVKADLGLA